MNHSLNASRVALLFVLVVVGAAFVWWAQNRPSYLLFQAHKELGHGNESGVIAEYRRLLSQKNLAPEVEIRFRKALGEFYIRALQESNGISLTYKNDYEVENPFVTDAKKEFERILVLNPSDDQAHYYLGRILWMQHLESFAMQELNLSREHDPKNPDPLWFLAVVHLERGEASTARELALQALAIRPDFNEARLTLVESYAALGDSDDALKEYDRLSPSFKENPDTKAQHALYLANENAWEEANQTIDDVVKTAPDNGRVKIDYGRILLERGLSEEAAGQFAHAAALMPRNVWPLVWQAKACWLRGECEGGARISQLLVEGLPRWGWAHLVNAWSRLCKGNDALALVELEEAARLSPELFDAYELRAQILIDKEQFDELGKVLRVLLDKRINQSVAYAFLAESFLFQKNLSMAQDMAESSIRLNQRNPRAFVWLGLARAGLKNTQGASLAFENALSLRPFDVEVQGYKVYGLATPNDLAHAEENLRTLLNGHSRSATLWFLIGEICRRQNEWPQAIEAYQNALERKPYLLKAHLGLISAYEASHRGEKAEAAVRAALEIKLQKQGGVGVARQNSQASVTLRARWPWATFGLVCLQIYVFSIEKKAMRWGIIHYMLDDYAFRWERFASHAADQLPNLISHTFMHANESHLIGNVLFFLLFAPSVERTMGSLVFGVNYFLWGCAAALTQGFFSPFSSGLIGASGAISGAAGAFFVLFPLRMPATFLTPVLGRTIGKVPAFFFIGLWFVGQLGDGFRLLMPDPIASQVTPIAHWAHIGGFAAGALSVTPFLFGRWTFARPIG